MKAPLMVRNNISALLAARKETQTALADWVGHHKTWISQFLRGERDELQFADLDKIADFFGIATYQLFQPGISRLTERRRGTERRMGQDRRIGHQGRTFATLQAEHGKLPRAAYALSASRGSLPAAVQRIIDAAERDIAAYYARQQTPTDRPPGADVPDDHRSVRRPRAK